MSGHWDWIVQSPSNMIQLLSRTPLPRLVDDTYWCGLFLQLLDKTDVSLKNVGDHNSYDVTLIQRFCSIYKQNFNVPSPFTGEFMRRAIIQRRHGWIEALATNQLCFPFNPNLTSLPNNLGKLASSDLRYYLKYHRGPTVGSNAGKDVLYSALHELTYLTPLEESLRQRDKTSYHIINEAIKRNKDFNYDRQVLLKKEKLLDYLLAAAYCDDVELFQFLIDGHLLTKSDFLLRVHEYTDRSKPQEATKFGTLFQLASEASIKFRGYILRSEIDFLISHPGRILSLSAWFGRKNSFGRESFRLPFSFTVTEKTQCYFECEFFNGLLIGLTTEGEEKEEFLYYTCGRILCSGEISLSTGEKNVTYFRTIGIAFSLTTSAPSFTIYSNNAEIGRAPNSWVMKLVEKRKAVYITVCISPPGPITPVNSFGETNHFMNGIISPSLSSYPSFPSSSFTPNYASKSIRFSFEFGHSSFKTERSVWAESSSNFQSVVDFTGKLMPKRLQYRAETGAPGDHGSWKDLEICQLPCYFYDWIDIIRSGDLQLVQTILNAFPDNASYLVHFLDNKSCPAINLAPEEIKKELKKSICFLGRYDDIKWIHLSETSLVGLAFDLELKCDVALKFLHEKKSYEQEVNNRSKYTLDSNYIINILISYDVESDPDFANNNKVGSYGCSSKSRFPYCIVMPACARDLLTVLQQENIAKKDFSQIKSIFRQICCCVDHLHSKNILHGDIKPLNIMRTYNSIMSYVLIDLDSSVDFADSDSFVHKGSSAYAPPERFRFDEEKRQYVKRSDLRPDRAYDLWALGAVLYFLCSGESLFPNAYDELSTGELVSLYEWTEATKFSKLAKLPQQEEIQLVAKDLISKLLVKDVQERITLEKLMNHPFINYHPTTERGESEKYLLKMQEAVEEIRETSQKQLRLLTVISERTKRIEDVSNATLLHIRKTEQVLLRGIYEASEVDIPTCFIIVNQELLPHQQWKELESDEKSKLSVSHLMEKASKWFDALTKISEALSDPQQSLSNAVTSFWNRFKDETLYLYLVDEFNFEPIIPEDPDSPYPIPIERPSEVVVKRLLPFLKVSYKAMSVLNEVSGIARMFGYPTPYLSSSTLTKAKEFIGSLDKGSSISEFATLHEISTKIEPSTLSTSLKTAVLSPSSLESNKSFSSSEIKNVRGKGLRELKQFFDKYDQGYDFCSLRRVCTPEGFSCWTTEENMKLMEIKMDPPCTKRVITSEELGITTTGMMKDPPAPLKDKVKSINSVSGNIESKVSDPRGDDDDEVTDQGEGGGRGEAMNPMLLPTELLLGKTASLTSPTIAMSPSSAHQVATDQKIDHLLFAVEEIQKQIKALNVKQDNLTAKYDAAIPKAGSRCIIT